MERKEHNTIKINWLDKLIQLKWNVCLYRKSGEHFGYTCDRIIDIGKFKKVVEDDNKLKSQIINIINYKKNLIQTI